MTNREKVILAAADKTHKGLPADMAGYAQVKEPDCSDLLEIGFLTRREIITAIGYQITETACLPAHACAAVACRLAQDRPVLEAYLITADMIAKELSDDGQLDPGQVHCAMMAELALKQAVISYSRQRKV